MKTFVEHVFSKDYSLHIFSLANDGAGQVEFSRSPTELSCTSLFALNTILYTFRSWSNFDGGWKIPKGFPFTHEDLWWTSSLRKTTFYIFFTCDWCSGGSYMVTLGSGDGVSPMSIVLLSISKICWLRVWYLPMRSMYLFTDWTRYDKERENHWGYERIFQPVALPNSKHHSTINLYGNFSSKS